jgi:two-component system, sensor histidine kinase and response regulator
MISVQIFNRSSLTENKVLFERDGNLEKILTGEWNVPTLCKKMAELTKSKLCCVLLSKRDSEDSDSVFNIVYTTDPGISLCKDIPILNLSFEEKIIVISNNILNDPRNENFDINRCSIKTFCGIPILKNDVVYGQIILSNRKKGYSISTVKKLKSYINMISSIVISQDDNFIFQDGRKTNELKFLSSIVHEIRTPIHGIVSMISLLSEVGKLNKKQSEYISCALSSCEDLIETVKDTIDFQKIKFGSLGIVNDSFDLRDVLTNIIDLVRFKAERKGLYLNLNIDSKIPKMVYGDKDRIRQVIINLVGNAINFTQKGGVKVTVKQYSPNVIISIKDTGCGIKTENQKKIFQSYFQEEKYTKSGMGLGLSLSQKLVQMMGGGITVESIYGKGTTFTIDIPLTEERYNIEELSDDDKILSVLVVDDNELSRIQLRKYLTQWKVDVDAVSTFKEAQTMIELCEYDIFMINASSNVGLAFNFINTVEVEFPESRIVALNKFSGDDYVFDGYILDTSNKLDVFNVLLHAKKKKKLKRSPSFLVNLENTRICIVEDDDISGYALKEILISIGITPQNIIIIDNGEQAVRDITHSRYNIVFMDFKLKSEMTGIYATKLIKENIPVKIIGVTASVTDDEKIEWLNSGIDALLFKPFSSKTIKDLLGKYVSF